MNGLVWLLVVSQMVLLLFSPLMKSVTPFCWYYTRIFYPIFKDAHQYKWKYHIIPLFYMSIYLYCTVIFFKDVLPTVFQLLWSLEVWVIIPSILVMPLITGWLSMTTIPESTKTSTHSYKSDGIIFHPGVVCKTCKVTKRARSKHCSICDQCTLLADHHCIWINNCIGRGNYQYFYSFLLSNFVLLAYAFIRLLIIQRKVQSKPLLVLSILCGCFAVIIVVFGYFQYMLIQNGMTTNEEDKWYTIQEMMRKGNLVVTENGRYFFRVPKEDDESEIFGTCSPTEPKSALEGSQKRLTSLSPLFDDSEATKETNQYFNDDGRLIIGGGGGAKMHLNKPVNVSANGGGGLGLSYSNPNTMSGGGGGGAGLDVGKHSGIGGGLGAGFSRNTRVSGAKTSTAGGGGGAGLDIGSNFGMGGGGGAGLSNITLDGRNDFSSGSGGGAGFGFGDKFGVGGGSGVGLYKSSDSLGNTELSTNGGGGAGLDVGKHFGIGGGGGGGINSHLHKDNRFETGFNGGGGIGSHFQVPGSDMNADIGGGLAGSYQTSTGLQLIENGTSIDIHGSVLGKKIDYNHNTELKVSHPGVAYTFYSTNPYDNNEYYLRSFRVVGDHSEIPNIYDKDSFWENLKERIS